MSYLRGESLCYVLRTLEISRWLHGELDALAPTEENAVHCEGIATDQRVRARGGAPARAHGAGRVGVPRRAAGDLIAYRGGNLRHLFSEQTTAEPTRLALRDIAGDVGEAWTRRAAALTPVDTGRLAQRWRSLEVEKVPGGYASGTENPSPIAHLIEHGVAPHDLGEGEREGAQHPGHAGAFMLARSAEEVVSEFEAIAQPRLSRWASAVERNAKRHKFID